MRTFYNLIEDGRSTRTLSIGFSINDRGIQAPRARSHGPLSSARWRLKSVGPKYGICFMLPFWLREFEVVGRYLKNKLRVPLIKK
jgi:hypothetical protein